MDQGQLDFKSGHFVDAKIILPLLTRTLHDFAEELYLVNREVPSLSVYLGTPGMTGTTAWVADAPARSKYQ